MWWMSCNILQHISSHPLTLDSPTLPLMIQHSPIHPPPVPVPVPSFCSFTPFLGPHASHASIASILCFAALNRCTPASPSFTLIFRPLTVSFFDGTCHCTTSSISSSAFLGLRLNLNGFLHCNTSPDIFTLRRIHVLAYIIILACT